MEQQLNKQEEYKSNKQEEEEEEICKTCLQH